MKNIFCRMFLIVVCAPCLFAQITITQSDYQNFFSEGKQLRIKSTDSPTTISIGQAGGGAQTFDFTGEKYTNRNFYITYFALANSPGDPTWPHARDHAAGFNNAPLCEYYINDFGFTYFYYHLNDTALLCDGEYDSGFPYVDSIFHTPPEPVFNFPFTLGSHWTYVSNPRSLNTSRYWDTISVVCDAFGTLIINNDNAPVSYNCIRVMTTDVALSFDSTTNKYSSNTTLDYNYYTKEGFRVDVTDTDGIGATTIIPENIDIYYTPGSAGVENQFIPGKNNFTVAISPMPISRPQHSIAIKCNMQNSGTTKFSLVDLLGREVATVHEGMQQAGAHVFHANIPDLPSGMYFGQLTVGASIAACPIVIEQ